MNCYGFEYVDVFRFQRKENTLEEIVSVLPLNTIYEYGITFEEGKKYFREKIAVEMTPNRIVERYEDVLYEVEGKSLKAKVRYCWEGENGEHITFF